MLPFYNSVFIKYLMYVFSDQYHTIVEKYVIFRQNYYYLLYNREYIIK